MQLHLPASDGGGLPASVRRDATALVALQVRNLKVSQPALQVSLASRHPAILA